MGLTIKSYAEWTHYKKGSNEEIEISKSFRDEMIKKEQTLIFPGFLASFI